MTLFETRDFFMLRTPILPIQNYLKLFPIQPIHTSIPNIEHRTALLEFVKDPLIRESIAVASPTLLESLSAPISSHPPKKLDQTSNSTMRYLLRMTTRATPFGLHAGVTYGEFGDHTAITLQSKEMHQKRTRPSMGWLLKLIAQLEQKYTIVKQLTVQQNSLLHLTGNRASLPYVAKNVYEGEQVQFNSSSLYVSPVVKLVFDHTEKPIAFDELLHIIQQHYSEVSEEKIGNFLWDLLKQDYLVSELRPPMLIDSPFTYVVEIIDHLQYVEDLRSKLTVIRQMIQHYDQTKIGSGEQLFLSIVKTMQEIIPMNNPLQVDLSVATDDVTINHSLQEEISKVAEVMWLLSSPIAGSNHLQEYREAFIEKYGIYRKVPLLELLDESQGLGAPAGYEYPISKRTSKTGIRDQKRHSILLNHLVQSIAKREMELEITDELLRQLEPAAADPDSAPDSMELYFTIAANSKEAIDRGEYKLLLGQNTGSRGAGKTFGRFIDILDRRIDNELEQLHQHEQSLHPNDIFAEVAYLPHTEQGQNVVITSTFRPYEISIGTNSSKNIEHSITMKDLYVSATSDALFLFSESLQKKVIPRSGHMYNYSVSPNLYRFLMEIGFEGVRQWTHFDWGYLEDSPFLPRIRFGKTILAPARWKLGKTTPQFAGKSSEDWKHNFQVWRSEWNVARYVFLTVNDHRMLLDFEHPLHLEVIQTSFYSLNDADSITLFEMGYDFNEAWVNGADGNYLMECVFPIVKAAPTVQRNSKQSATPLKIPYLSEQDRLILPGEEWMYLKMYGPIDRQDELIGIEIEPFCRKMKEQGISETAYFIRYADPKPHIRLRMKGRPEQLWSEGMTIANDWCNRLKEDGLLHYVEISSYVPEIERYGGTALFPLAENIFSADSDLVGKWVSMIRLRKTNWSKDLLAVLGVIDYLENMGLSFKEQFNWLDNRYSYKEYLNEFRIDRKQFLEIGNSLNDWENLKATSEGTAFYQDLAARQDAIRKYSEAVRHHHNLGALSNSLDSIIASVVHMFLNRFIGVDRTREIKIMTLARHTLNNLRYSRQRKEAEVTC